MKTCEFCGQVVMDDYCDCPEAEKERRIIAMKKEAKDIVDDIGQDASIDVDVIEVLKDAIEIIADGVVKKIALQLNAGMKFTIKMGTKQKIEIEQSQTTKMKAETQTEI